ncbi:hypothetical protein L7F22_030172 [Adiantum nelumboides]|nr:hypothetical protein [Adiantum nelumboides]
MKRWYVKCIWVREFQKISLLVSSKDVHFHQLFLDYSLMNWNTWFMQQEGIEEVMIGNAMNIFLLYADDVVLLVHSLEDAKKLMVALKSFCLHSGLIMNGSKTKVVLVKTLNKEKPCIVYNKEPLEVVESFKYLWGGTISKSTWKEFVNVQKHFLTKFFQVKTQTLYMLLLLESGSLSIEVMGMERLVGYMQNMQKRASHRLPKIAWEASKKVQKTHKSKLLCSRWMQDMMVWKMGCITLTI